MSKKILYVASTVGHLKSFHLPYLKRLNQDGWTVHTAGQGADIPLPGAEKGFDIPFEKSMFSPKNLKAVWELRQLLRREKYDVISVHTSLAAFFARLAVMISGKRPVVINTVHGYLFDEDTPLIKRTILLLAEKITAGCTDLLLTMNRQDTQIAEKHRLCRGKIIQTDGMGVDFSRFSPANQEQRMEARQRFGIPQKAFVLVYAAEFSERKNQAGLLRAFAKLPDNAWLLLAGRGATVENCQALAEKLGVANRVVFAGFVPGVQVCYHAADVCVSTSRSEGLPFNLMEAMYCALPVVATRVKGHEDLIREGKTGFLVPYGDENALCSVLKHLMKKPALGMELGYEGKRIVERYGLEQVFEVNVKFVYETATHFNNIK